MPVAWFFAPYARRVSASRPTRYCVMDDFTEQITADGGGWAEAECLGDQAVVKVNASSATIQAIVADGRFDRVPLRLLDESLASLTNAQRNAVRNKLLELGYADDEILQRLGSNLGTKTLGDVLRFALRRRLKPRYVEESDTIVLDGEDQVCRTVESVDAEV